MSIKTNFDKGNVSSKPNTMMQLKFFRSVSRKPMKQFNYVYLLVNGRNLIIYRMNEFNLLGKMVSFFPSSFLISSIVGGAVHFTPDLNSDFSRTGHPSLMARIVSWTSEKLHLHPMMNKNFRNEEAVASKNYINFTI